MDLECVKLTSITVDNTLLSLSCLSALLVQLDVCVVMLQLFLCTLNRRDSVKLLTMSQHRRNM